MTAMLSEPIRSSVVSCCDNWVALDHISWDLYERLFEETDGQNVRITYDRGRLVFMTLGRKHETFKTLIGRLIEQIPVEWDVPLSGSGSMTCKREDLAKGFESDECYYIQHEAEMLDHDQEKLDLTRDPPPDLAVEVEITNFPIDREALYASFGVPELWRFNGERVVFLKLGNDGKYQSVDHSLAFPKISPADIDRFLAMSGKIGQSQIIRAFRDWLRSVK